MLGNGRRWTDAAIRTRPPEQRERLRRSLDHMAEAVAGYVAGALTIAVIAGVRHLHRADRSWACRSARRWP